MPSMLSLRLAATAAALALAACQPQSADHGPAASHVTSAASTPAHVIAAAPAPAGTASLPGDHATTARYRIRISLPALPADEQTLANALRTTADNAKRQFLKALPDPDALPHLASRQFDLIINFKQAANTTAFTSVRESGNEDTGGAHPIPFEAGFVFDRKAGKLITMDDLFATPDAARAALAKVTHAALLKKFMRDAPTSSEGSPEAIREWKANMLQMLDGGTRPTTINYAIFVVRAGATPDAPSPGLTLVFPPYQVAPYVFGTQSVDVSTDVFAQFLQPAYRSDFATQP